MQRRIAILALAIVLVLSVETFPGSVSPARRTSIPSRPHTSTQTSAHRTPSRTTARVRRVRYRRRRWYNPWHIGSFGDSGARDNPAGEDPQVRQAAVEALGNWNGSVIVVDPNTGRILSIVNQKLALGSGFTPCSTFKPIVALAALKEGVITQSQEVRIGRRTSMTLTEALARSNNVFFARVAQRLGFRRLEKYAHEFGLGEKAGNEIPEESPGRFPSQAPAAGGVGRLASYGEGIDVTPLQMAAVAAAFANGGTLYALQYPRTPEEAANFQPIVKRRLDDLAPIFPAVRDGMSAAVLYGTARLAYDPELDIFGKTGTCSEDGARLGWFVSYGGDLESKYSVVVLLRGGRPMFGPHAAEIAGHLYHELHSKDIRATQAQHQASPTGTAPR